MNGSVPPWEPQPDVWLLVAVLGVGYVIALARLAPRDLAGTPSTTRLQKVSFGVGLLALLVAAGWPIHQVAEQRMFSVHMVQHLLLTMVVVPLLLLGTPSWLLRWILRPGTRTFAVIRWSARFLPALIIFNLVVVFSHWPQVVNESLGNAAAHFGVHAVLFVSSLIVWLPVVSPLPEIPRLAPIVRCLYLFGWSIVPTVPASFLTFNSQPLYSAYVGLPKLWGLNALEDQQNAGLIMKIGAGLLLWALIAVIFFRWAADEERAQQTAARRPSRTLEAAQHDLDIEPVAPGQ